MSGFKQDLPLGGNGIRHGVPVFTWTIFSRIIATICLVLLIFGSLKMTRIQTVSFLYSPLRSRPYATFYVNVTPVVDLCPGASPEKPVISYSGYVGLKGDTTTRPKRSFFWYFEAEHNPKNAPVILVTGGGPGTSGLTGPLIGQSSCGITENGTRFNPSRWTEHFNLIALDHPIGVGFSYGERVNNSRDAAFDVYDFLQKFFKIFPHLSTNQFVLSGGSYGGVYMPNIATVIHEQNLAISNGQGYPNAKHINLESIMISNPYTSPISHFSWILQYRCAEKHVYNETACAKLHSMQPSCLEKIQLAYEIPTVENRFAANDFCENFLDADTNGTVMEDVRRKCEGDVYDCHPLFKWMNNFFSNPDTKRKLGVPTDLNFTAMSEKVLKDFTAYGDAMQPHHLLYSPLLRDGIRLLHYIGADDANCPWPGNLSFLKLLHSPYQTEFLNAKDMPWPSAEEANGTTARIVGSGAGKMTYILVNNAGHFIVRDQSALVKKIVDIWIPDKPFF
ncbi:Alpha/Beta hydrolase protein [Cyathus striatus]|nr:Alpha/Beta hydrolase protein [Cyathus striatus]